jgi:putative transposase
VQKETDKKVGTALGCAMTQTKKYTGRSACATDPMTFYRRNLPHWHPEGKTIFLTWRLYGSLPASVIKSTAKSGCATMGKQFVVLDRYLDSASTGPLWLSYPEIANSVERTIFRGADLGHYTLFAYVIMPNHVHALLQPEVSVARLTGTTKGVSARDANARLGRAGKPFWGEESFDHWVRSSWEFDRIRQYIEWNPVKTGLAARPEDWRWSSAYPEVVKILARLASNTARDAASSTATFGCAGNTGTLACAESKPR